MPLLIGIISFLNLLPKDTCSSTFMKFCPQDLSFKLIFTPCICLHYSRFFWQVFSPIRFTCFTVFSDFSYIKLCSISLSTLIITGHRIYLKLYHILSTYKEISAFDKILYNESIVLNNSIHDQRLWLLFNTSNSIGITITMKNP